MIFPGSGDFFGKIFAKRRDRDLKNRRMCSILRDKQDSERFCGEFHSTAPHRPRMSKRSVKNGAWQFRF